MTQTGTNTIHVENLTRSATAPLMRAAVMTAKVSWNPTKASSGMLP